MSENSGDRSDPAPVGSPGLRWWTTPGLVVDPSITLQLTIVAIRRRDADRTLALAVHAEALLFLEVEGSADPASAPDRTLLDNAVRLAVESLSASAT